MLKFPMTECNQKLRHSLMVNIQLLGTCLQVKLRMKLTVCLSRENKAETAQVYNRNHLADVGKVMGDSDFLRAGVL